MEPDGEHFLAVTDRGSWLRGRIVYRDGKPASIADVELAPILGGDGTPLAAYKWFDVESLTESDGLFYVGIERVEPDRALQYSRPRPCCARRADQGAAGFQDIRLQQGP